MYLDTNVDVNMASVGLYQALVDINIHSWSLISMIPTTTPASLGWTNWPDDHFRL